MYTVDVCTQPVHQRPPQAHAGLEPTTFPPHIPVWTGHYHKPHTVPGTSICYVGTPYQVSRAEAGQSKRLLVLSHEPVEAGGAATWQLVEEVGLDVGPRHFSVGVEEGPEALVAAAALTRTGDRLRWTLRDEGAAESVAPTLQALRDSGADICFLFDHSDEDGDWLVRQWQWGNIVWKILWKTLWGNIVGKYCGEYCGETIVGKYCGENIVGKVS